jgi:GAF domain-containing protein
LKTPDVNDFLTRLAVLAAAILPDISGGITLRRDNELATAATSDEFAMAVDDRWADYRIHALSYGVRSALSLPLVIAGESRGALNLYARVPHALDAHAIERRQAFAEQTATALTITRRRRDRG